MAHDSNDTHYEVCLIEGGSEGSVTVDIDAFLRFNSWIDRQLVQLESKWYCPRYLGSPRTANGLQAELE
jgi:hypothetical protein